MCASLQTWKGRQSMWSMRAEEQERPDQYELPERTPHACNEYFCISWQRRREQVESEWWNLPASCFYFPRRRSHFLLLQPTEWNKPPHWKKKETLAMKRFVWISPHDVGFSVWSGGRCPHTQLFNTFRCEFAFPPLRSLSSLQRAPIVKW